MKSFKGLLCMLLIATISCLGQGSENFSNLPVNNPTNTYANFSYVGDNGLSWTAVEGRTDQTLSGKAFCGRGQSPGSKLTSAVFPNGIGTLQFDYVRGFTNPRARNLTVFVNGTQIGVAIPVDGSSDIPAHYSQQINVAGNVSISIRFSGKQTIVDNIQWTAYSSIPQPEINLIGNSNNIVSGTVTTLITNHTDFGTAEVGVGSQIHTFTIENTGTANLTLTGLAPFCAISGANASDFVVSSPPSTPIPASGQTSFQITFSPSALGVRKATVSIANNDADENPYTFAISGTGTYSNQSKILDVTAPYSTTGPEFNSNVEYINFIDGSPTTTGKFIPMKLRIMDGPDSDSLPTILTYLRISVTDLAAANQLSMIKTAILTTSGGTVISTAAKVAGELVFSGMSGANVTANDDGYKDVHLRISVDETQVVDQTKLIFLVTYAASSPSGSSFTTPDAGGAQTDVSSSNNRNRLNVTATKLRFAVQPQDTPINATMSAVTVEAVDFYNRVDVNFGGTASITSTGTMTGSPLISSFVLGLANFNSVIHTVAGTALNLAANSGTLTSIISVPFKITEIIYLTGDYRTTANGFWYPNTASPAIWEKYNGISWDSNILSPPSNTTANVYIQHNITAGGPFNGVNLKIRNGGFFLVTYMSSSTSSIYIYEGGKLEMDLAMQNNGLFEVENNATVQIFYTVNYSSTLWNGIEKFHPKSNLVLIEWDPSKPLFNGLSISQNTFDGYTAAFGNVIIDVQATADATLLNPGLTANLAHGNLIFRRFPVAKSLRLSNGGAITTEIGGDFIVESGYIAKINSCTNGSLNFGIRGNMILNDGETRISTLSSANTSTFTVNGNIDMTGPAILNMNSTSAGSAYSTINLKGNLNCPSTATIKSGNTSPNDNINFIGTSLQTINVATNVLGSNSNVVYNVGLGGNVAIINQDLKLGTGGIFNVLDGGTLDFGFNGSTALNISRAGSATGTKFSSAAGSTLKITSPDGISASSGTIGNVQTSIAPSYNGLATFWYQGKQNQITGSGLPNTASGKLVYVNMDQDNLSLSLTTDVNITNATTLDPLGGKLEIQKGIVLGSNTKDFFGTGRLKMSGGEYKISTYYTSNPETTYLPRLSNYGNYALSGGQINLAANNQTQVISGVPTYYSLQFSGSNTLGANYKGISTATAVANSILIAANAIADVKSSSFGMLPFAPTFTMTDDSRFITAGTGVKPDASGNYSLGPNTIIEFSNNSAMTIQRPRLTSPIPAYANIVVSGSNVGNISPGGGPNSNLSFQPSGSFRVTPTGTYKLFNNFGFSGTANTAIKSSNSPTITLENGSTIEYNGDNQTITPFNQNANPSTLYYTNLTISGSGQKTLGTPQNVFINENLRLNSANLLVNTNEVITVGDAVISTSGTMQIENNGQLIQINDGASNSGTGISYKRIAQAKNLDYIYWSSPVENFATLSLPGNNHYQWNTLFANTNGTQGNWEAPSTIMTNGRGYIARASNGATAAQDLTNIFLGKPNNGIVTIPVFRGDYTGIPYDAEPLNPNNAWTTKDDDNWNLIGNPYPSAIDAEKFLVENQFILQGAVHIWTHTNLPTSAADFYYADFAYNYYESDYTIYNKLGTSIPNTFNGKIAAGQGFMVNMLDAAASGTPVVFKNAMRYNSAFAPYDNSNFYKTQNAIDTEEKSRIWLDLVNITTAEVGTILVGYAEEATMGKDYFYDCSFESRGDHSLYSLIDQESFVIQGRALPFNIDDIVPLGYSLNHLGDLAISIREVDGIFAAETPIILEDKELNIFHDLKSSPYFFTSEIGTFNHRFQLRYGIVLSNSNFEMPQSNVQIIGNHGIIYIKSSQNPIDEVYVYDVLGRLLLKSEAQNSLYIEIPFNTIAKQAIIVKAKLANGNTVSQKIIF